MNFLLSHDSPLTIIEQISLVDKEQVPTLSHALLLLLLPWPDSHVPDVLFQVLAPEPEWIPGVDDLHDEVTALHDAPELTPDFQVALERRQDEVLRVRQLRQRTTPVQERVGFETCELSGRSGGVPAWSEGSDGSVSLCRVLLSPAKSSQAAQSLLRIVFLPPAEAHYSPPRYAQPLTILTLSLEDFLFLLTAEQEGVGSSSRRIAAPALRRSNDGDISSLSRKVGISKLRSGKELFEIALVRDGG